MKTLIKEDLEKNLLIYGCGGHARSLADVALSNGHRHILFIDENAKPNEQLFGFHLIKSLDHYHDLPLNEKANTILALGDNHKRAELFDQLVQTHQMISIVSNKAHWGINASIAPGVFVGHGAHIGPNATIGTNTIINTHAVIEHDCQIGQHSHIAVNTTIAGGCRIGDFVMIGAGATVIDGISVCSHVTIGAGAVVIKDITEPGTYVGIPAQKIG